MKKVFLLSVVLMALAGCNNKEDDPKEEEKLDDRLVGTKWQTRDDVYEMIWGGVAYDTYEFTSATEAERYTVKGGSAVQSRGAYTYELDYPNLNLIDKDGDILDFEFKDTRTIVRKGRNENIAYNKYIKQ